MVKVLVEKSVLKDLVYSKLELDSLEAMGVDNWEGYGETDVIEDSEVESELAKISTEQEQE